MPDSGISKKLQPVVNPEARFIERLKKGEPSAMSEVLQKHGPAIYKFLYWFLGDRGQADEALEAIMVVFMKAVLELGEDDKVEAALWREAHRTAVKMVFGGGQPTPPRVGSKRIFPVPAYLTESEDEDVKRLVAAWEELAPPYREAWALSGIEPLVSYEKAEGVIEGTQGTLRSRLTYALRRFLKDVK